MLKNYAVRYEGLAQAYPGCDGHGTLGWSSALSSWRGSALDRCWKALGVLLHSIRCGRVGEEVRLDSEVGVGMVGSIGIEAEVARASTLDHFRP